MVLAPDFLFPNLKYAQLNVLDLSQYSVILLDESQDTDQCQLDLYVEQIIVKSACAKHIYMVGDAAQTIYSFRGAKSKFMTDLARRRPSMNIMSLTHSFRFDQRIAALANQILFIKQYSPQRLGFTPYRVQGVASTPAEIFGHDHELDFPYTFLARSNAEIIMESLNLVARYPGIKLYLKGGAADLKSLQTDLVELYHFKNDNKKPKNPYFEEFDSFEEFSRHVEEQEMTKYLRYFSLLKSLGARGHGRIS